MAFKLDKPAEGLTGALNLKVLGQSPPVFGDTLLPTYEARDYYLAREIVSKTIAVGPAALAAFTVLTINVPAGKCWHLWQISLGLGTGVVPAAQIYDLACFFKRAQQAIPIGVAALLLDTANLPSLVGSQTFVSASRTFETPVILYGGDNVQGYNQIAVPAVGASLRLTVAVTETDY